MRALAAALVLASCAAPAPADEPAPLDEPARVEVDAGSPTDEVRCAACHAPQAEAWSRSLHAISATDPLYLAERARGAPGDDGAFCAGCHAPSGASIGCGACHVREGAILATRATGHAPHAVSVEPSLGDERACAGCHDFDFPHVPGLAMQDTIDEWRASAPGRRGETCTRCHDPHATPARRDAAMAATALEVDAEVTRRGAGARVVLVLRSRAGHAVPTGDLYRRLVVRARSGSVEREAILARRFALRDGRRTEIADDRVPADGERRVVLDLPRAPRAITWTIDLEALPAERARDLMIPEHTWTTRLAEGELRVER